MCRNCLLNRREFVETMSVFTAGTLMTSALIPGASASSSAPDPAMFQWDPDAPMFHPCKTLRVQPVLMYRD